MESLAFSTPLSGNVSSFPTSVSDKSDSSSPKIYGDEGFCSKAGLVCGADGCAWSLPPDLLIFFPTVCYNLVHFFNLSVLPLPLTSSVRLAGNYSVQFVIVLVDGQQELEQVRFAGACALVGCQK
jgi:hypothetical protein